MRLIQQRLHLAEPFDKSGVPSEESVSSSSPSLLCAWSFAEVNSSLGVLNEQSALRAREPHVH